MTTPRTSADYAEAKRAYAEKQLASGKGMPTARPGPVIDMHDEPQLPSCCCMYPLVGAVAFAFTFLCLAAGQPSSEPPYCVGALGNSRPAAPYHVISSVPPIQAGLVIPPCPAPPLALTNAVATVNVAVNKAAAAYASTLAMRGGPDQSALIFMAKYIHGVNPDVDAGYVTHLLSVAGEQGEVDPLLLLCLARYESTFNIADVGAAGERGLLQIHPCHKRSMKRAGLDFYSEADRLTFACQMMKRSGLKPWTVRKRAMKLYRNLKGE